jgi:hypothetical protein
MRKKMTKGEKKKWLEALDETEERWKEATWNDEGLCPRNDDMCPLCAMTPDENNYCDKCIVAMSGILKRCKKPKMYQHCMAIIFAANEQRRKRPIIRAIARMRKWLEDN